MPKVFTKWNYNIDLVNTQANLSEIVLFKQQKITCFDKQYVQIKSCSDVKIVFIGLSVLLWFTDSDYPFGTFNLFFHVPTIYTLCIYVECRYILMTLIFWFYIRSSHHYMILFFYSLFLWNIAICVK
jgi:hypothetical protein